MSEREHAAWLRMQLVEHRMSPNLVVRALVERNPEILAENVQVLFLESALSLERQYLELGRNEWNDWLRIDYWGGISIPGRERGGGGAGLLQTISETYRAISLLSGDIMLLRRGGHSPVTGMALLQLWEARNSGYF